MRNDSIGFSSRLNKKIRHLITILICIMGMTLTIYLFNSINAELTFSENILHEHLREDVSRALNYGEIIQLQPVLTTAARTVDSGYLAYISLQTKSESRQIAYAGDHSAENSLFKRTSVDRFVVPYLGEVELKLVIGFDRKIQVLSLTMFIIIILFWIMSIITMKQVQFAISDQSVGIDELENVLRNLENNIDRGQFKKAALMIQDFTKTKANLAAAEQTNMLAKQVAHDIRSPLSALNFVMSTLNNMPYEKRELIFKSIQRINDIANDLLKKNKVTSQRLVAIDTPSSEQEIFSVVSAVKSIVAEKSALVGDNKKIKIEYIIKDSQNIYVAGNQSEFSRAISNLINNSIEAMKEENGEIIILSKIDNDQVQIQIKDNGTGIPPFVMEKIGLQGVSFGKDNSHSGSGLGLYHAKKTVENMAGHFSVDSTYEKETIITIVIPLVRYGTN